MIANGLHEVLDQLADTGEIVIRVEPRGEAGDRVAGAGGDDELADAWRLARREANAALEHWRDIRTRAAFSVFRAAEDRADAAQDALASR